MLVYAGVHKAGFVQPQTLANHDIVIVSYETLRKEIDYVDLPHSNSMALFITRCLWRFNTQMYELMNDTYFQVKKVAGFGTQSVSWPYPVPLLQ